MAVVKEEHKTIRDSVYQALKNDIITGKLKWGEQLKEAQLATEYHVSRSPVREALHLLSGDGLVVNHPHRGVFVRQITKEEVDELIHLRLLLENRGISLAITSITPKIQEELLEVKEALTKSLRDSDFETYAAADLRLHRLLISLCRNSLIEKYYDQLSLLVWMLNVWSIQNPERFKLSYAEYMVLIHHLLCGNSHDAAMVNASSLSRSKDELYRIIDSMEQENNKK